MNEPDESTAQSCHNTDDYVERSLYKINILKGSHCSQIGIYDAIKETRALLLSTAVERRF